MDIQTTYSNIAPAFSRTRYSVWNGVRKFLDSLPSNSIVADIGCGNGKNMLYRTDLYMKGMDICNEFLTICKQRGLDVCSGSVTEIPFQENSVDHTICIAVIHHLRSREERQRAIQELLRITKPNGTILIYVWAFEQPLDAKRQFASQDELVPFHTSDGIFHRFYHLYKKGELEEDVGNTAIILESINEKGNWYVVLKKTA